MGLEVRHRLRRSSERQEALIRGGVVASCFLLAVLAIVCLVHQ